ncbi:MAG: hypothetical protein DDG59_14920 [Anaerolineae bacterium]|nr:MAG: hypothetical protein DDG59_14920 [Anaerolineae bacterium]
MVDAVVKRLEVVGEAEFVSFRESEEGDPHPRPLSRGERGVYLDGVQPKGSGDFGVGVEGGGFEGELDFFQFTSFLVADAGSDKIVAFRRRR